MNDENVDIDPVFFDVVIAYNYIINKLNIGNISGVFLSQLYAVIPNKTTVDEGIYILRNNHKYKVLSCKEYGLDDLFIVDTLYYLKCIQDHKLSAATDGSFIQFIQQSSAMSLNGEERMKFLLFDDSVINQLMINGFLCSCRDFSADKLGQRYWITLPNLGYLIREVTEDCELLIKCIKSTKYKELSRNQVIRSNILSTKRKRARETVQSQQLDKLLAKCTIVGMDYVLLLAEGSSIIMRVKNSTGDSIYRLS